MKKILSWLYIPYRYLVFAPLLAVSTLFFGSLTIILVQFVSAKTASYIGGVWWARFNSWITPMFVTVVGRENLDPGQSYVITANHQSQYDIFVLYGWLGVDFKWVMKKELRRVPALGAACEKLGHIFIDRSNSKAAVASLAEAREKLPPGASVLFFPEGTRSDDGRLKAFKKGAFVMALELGLPILPVSIIGTNRILPNRSIRLLPGRAKLVLHRPIETAGRTADEIEDLMKEVRAEIQAGLDQHAF